MTIEDKIKARKWVAHVDDERGIENGIIVTLAPGYFYQDDVGCGVRGFDTWSEAYAGTRSQSIYRTGMTK